MVNTVTCKKCGNVQDDNANFCSKCGSPFKNDSIPAVNAIAEREVYTKKFDTLSSEEMNQWLHSDLRIANVRADVSLEYSRCTFRYELLDGPNQYRYSFNVLGDWNIIGSSDGEEVLQSWKTKNPDAIVVEAKSATHETRNMNDMVFAFIPMFSSCKVLFCIKSRQIKLNRSRNSKSGRMSYRYRKRRARAKT